MRAGRTQDRGWRRSADGRTVIAWGLKRLAGAVFDETTLAPEPLIVGAAEATRFDVKLLTDPPASSKRSPLLPPASTKRRRYRHSDASRRART